MWSPTKSSRFKQDNFSNYKNPPPGTYNPSDQDSASGYGNYILSNFKTLGTKRIPPMSQTKMQGIGAHDGLFGRTSK